MAKSGAKLEVGWLIAASAAAFALWFLPLTRPLTIPLVYLNTHLHELAHALAALGTGGSVDHILVFADGSGVTPVRGGFLLFVASAGYVGASVIGGLLIASCRTTRNAQRALKVLAFAMALSMVIFVRGDVVGWIAGGLWTLALLVAAFRLTGPGLGFLVAFLGVQQCLTSIQSLLTLWQISVGTSSHSDALIMQNVTGLPAVVWAGLWMALSTVSIGLGIRTALKPEAKTS